MMDSDYVLSRRLDYLDDEREGAEHETEPRLEILETKTEPGDGHGL